MTGERIPWWLSGALVAGTFGVLLWLEHRRPLRRSVEPKLRRSARNLGVAGLSAATVQLVEMPFVLPLATFADQRQVGLVHLIPLPIWLGAALAVVLLDYTLYVWHVLVHKAPFLWRFHQTHHVDLDLDVSTALRFHFGEIAASVPWRTGQILLIGVSPLSLSIWQTALLMMVLFHHSNLKLPMGLERGLSRLIVTPRMHGIHHSVIRAETNSNWSSGLTLWDWLHGTLRLNVPQQEVTIGVPAYQEPARVTLTKVLTMPFTKQLDSWHVPGGAAPERPPALVPKDHLLA